MSWPKLSIVEIYYFCFPYSKNSTNTNDKSFACLKADILLNILFDFSRKGFCWSLISFYICLPYRIAIGIYELKALYTKKVTRIESFPFCLTNCYHNCS